VKTLLIRVLTALGACWLLAGGLPASAVARPVLFVGNLDDGTVTLVDMTALRVLGRINVIPDGSTPQDPAQAAAYPALVRAKGTNYVQGVALSPDGQTLYVSRGFLGDVAAFRLAGGQMLWRLQTSSLRADHLALSPDGRRLFVSALTSNTVQVIDTTTHAFVGSFPTGDWPHVIELSPDGSLVYNGSLGNQLAPSGADGHKQLTVADARTLEVVRTYPFEVGVRPFVFTADGRTAYVQLSYLNGFVELDLASGRVTRTVALPVMGPAVGEAPSSYPNQAAHHGIALSADGRLVCDAATVSDYVALVSRPDLRPVAIIPVGSQPAEARTSSDGRYCLVSNRGPGPAANFISVISYAQRREVLRLPTGSRPQEEQEAAVPDRVLGAAGFTLAPPPAQAPHGPGPLRILLAQIRPRARRVRIQLSEGARVTLVLEHRQGRGWAALGTRGYRISRAATLLSFPRVRHHRLAAGHYRLRISASASNAGAATVLRFRVP